MCPRTVRAGKRRSAAIGRIALALVLLLCANHAYASLPTGAILISDIHFDPFADPSKAALLAASPVTAWRNILQSPPSADRDAASARLRDRCGKDLYDTSPALFDSLTQAVSQHRTAVSFAVVTGDLLTHDFVCRFDAALPGRSHAEAQTFAESTVRYVVESLHHAAGPRPVYIALGNNDSDCNDYRLDRNDRLLQQTLPSIARAAGLSTATLQRQGFTASGRLIAQLPKPFQNTRILILDDVPSSARYQTCAGTKDASLADDDLHWLRQQLQSARASGQSVWFAAHIPPGIYPRNTLFKPGLCTARAPTMFLASDALTATLTGYADVVKLALFGHTHMDEFRLLSGGAGMVPAKVIPSVSPISGNRPAFLVAQIDPRTATMLDYTEHAAPTADAVTSTRTDHWAGNWDATYSFRQTYTADSFTAPALQKLLDRFALEPLETSAASASYIKWYSGGASEYGIAPVWKTYQCALKNTSQADFLTCACPASRESR